MWRGLATVVVALSAWALAACSSGHSSARAARAVSSAETTSALRVEAAASPQWVHGSDGREHIEYDLVVTNVFTANATLKSLAVSSPAGRLLSLSGTGLSAATLRLLAGKNNGPVVAPSSTVVIIVDVALPGSAGRAVPASLTNRIVYSIPAKASLRSVIGTATVQMPPLAVDRIPPVVIASPVRGTGWVNLNGCCADPSSNHRNGLFATSSGGYVTPEVFAIDWIRLANGLMFTGTGENNRDYPTYGAPLYAVADGTVVLVVDNRKDIPPGAQNPSLVLPGDYGGNEVLLKIGPSRYACYAHMQPGSVRVQPGQRVRVGQQIGLLGNSGNTTAPHLHFGIQRRPDCLSETEPFEINQFTLEGDAEPNPEVPHIKVVGTPRRERRALPLIRAVATL